MMTMTIGLNTNDAMMIMMRMAKRAMSEIERSN